MKMPSIVVCVPTYRRPAQLKALMTALAGQRGAEPFSILLGNNDATPVLDSVRALLPSGIVAEEIMVSTRGVVAVRNAMIAAVLARGDAVEWIACLDDDQAPSSEWLAELVAAGRRHGADLAGGPVRQVPERETFWSAGATATDYLPTQEGDVAMLNEAGNLLLSVRYLRTLTGPAFSPVFGRSGGEDYEFFLRARLAHARIIWAPRAIVTEVIPHDRLTLRGLVWRAYSTSAYQARADLLHGPASGVVRTLARDTVVLPAAVLRTLVRRRGIKPAASILVRRAAEIGGRVAGLAGRRMERYGGD